METPEKWKWLKEQKKNNNFSRMEKVVTTSENHSKMEVLFRTKDEANKEQEEYFNSLSAKEKVKYDEIIKAYWDKLFGNNT